MLSRIFTRRGPALKRSAQASGPRFASSESTVKPKSDAPWIAVSAALTIPALYYVTKPPSHDEGHHVEKAIPANSRNFGVSVALPEENLESSPSSPEKGQETFKTPRPSAPENQPKLEDHHSGEHENDYKQDSTKSQQPKATLQPDPTKLGDAARLAAQGHSHSPKTALAEHFTARDATSEGGAKGHPGDKEATVISHREGDNSSAGEQKAKEES